MCSLHRGDFCSSLTPGEPGERRGGCERRGEEMRVEVIRGDKRRREKCRQDKRRGQGKREEEMLVFITCIMTQYTNNLHRELIIF